MIESLPLSMAALFTAGMFFLMMVQVETILVSIISMLSSPNDESPANIDAAVSVLVSCKHASMAVLILTVEHSEQTLSQT